MRRAIPTAAALLIALAATFPAAASTMATYQSAAVCMECHPEIFRSWAGSQHASSFTDPAFQLPYDRVRRTNPKRTLACEQCHNPMRFLLSPGDPRAAIFSREGVTCDFCHSVESMNPGDAFPRYKARPGIKFGPREKSAVNSPHVRKFSSLHITSEFCAGCHEYRNEFGAPILTTASEWEQSFYRGTGVHCQFCHLPELFDARFIDGKKGKGPLDHAMVGGHSRERLARAIPVHSHLVLSGKGATVTVSLKNELVGHATPTGIPTHRIRLTAALFDAVGNPLGAREELFEKVMGDGTGKALVKPEDIFLSAREVLKDNRIKPKETREVKFTFPPGETAPATAAVSVTYEMPTPDIAPAVRYIEIPIASQVVLAERSWAPRKAVILLASGALAFLVWLMFRKKGAEKE
jgi:hypothetical protein